MHKIGGLFSSKNAVTRPMFYTSVVKEKQQQHNFMSFSVVEDCLSVWKKTWYLILGEHEINRITAQENYETKQKICFAFC